MSHGPGLGQLTAVEDVDATAGPAAGDRVPEQVGDPVRLDQDAGIAVRDRVVHQPDSLVACEVGTCEPLETDVRAIHRVSAVGYRGGRAGVRGDAERPLE